MFQETEVNGKVKTVKSVYLENVIIPTIELGECHRCDEDNAVEYFREEVPRGYVWETYCHSCREKTSGYEF
ncbi:hypothetical protein S101413_00536 [Bacillus velezensis]|nr:hypothetical protein S101413_00536 [Bacillus velezensis]